MPCVVRLYGTWRSVAPRLNYLSLIFSNYCFSLYSGARFLFDLVFAYAREHSANTEKLTMAQAKGQPRLSPRRHSTRSAPQEYFPFLFRFAHKKLWVGHSLVYSSTDESSLWPSSPSESFAIFDHANEKAPGGGFFICAVEGT